MASNTKQTRFRRKIRRKKAGRDRKVELINLKTPTFEIHTPEIDAAAPPAQVSPKE